MEIFSNATASVRSMEGYQEILGDNLKESVKHMDSLNLIEYVKKKVCVYLSWFAKNLNMFRSTKYGYVLYTPNKWKFQYVLL